MRAFLWAVSCIALGVSPLAWAQEAPSPSVNQRMTGPTNQSDAYMSVSLGQLIVALGMTLHGVPPHGLDEIRLIHSRQTAEAPPRTRAPAAGDHVSETNPLEKVPPGP